MEYCRNVRPISLIFVLMLGFIWYGVHVYDQAHRVQTNLYYLGSGSTDATGENPSTISKDDRKKASSKSKKRTKVLLLTYMRGGSTLLGEMLNQNPEATFWFEPIDGVYSDLYGAFSGWFPLDILQTQEGEPREIPEFEERAIFRQFDNLLSCHIEDMPIATLGHYAITHIPQKRFKEYSECLTEINKEGPIAPWYCQAKIRNACPRYFSKNDSLISNCYYCLHEHKDGTFPGTEYQKGYWQHMAPTFDRRCKLIKEPLKAYSKCIINYRDKVRPCLPLIKNVCQNSEIIGAKTIRLGVDIALKLLEQYPDLKLVYQSRDPRGIVHSRQRTGLLSRYSEKNLTKEAGALCSRIRRELAILQRMELIYPERVMQIRYEDLVLDPRGAANEFYEFLGRDLPPNIEHFLVNSIHSNDQGTAFSTTRKNGTDSVYKWRTALSLQNREVMSQLCSDVLKYFGYPDS